MNTSKNSTKTLQTDLKSNIQTVKQLLPSEDILSYEFTTADGVPCALFYADGMVNKELLGQLVAKPLAALRLNAENEGGRAGTNGTDPEELVEKTARFPELKKKEDLDEMIKEVLDGNTLLLVDGLAVGFIAGAKLLPVRAVVEPPTDVAVKGPREGFIEDVKTNMALVRKRLKTPELRFETLRVGKRSDTAVVLCWLEGTSNAEIKDELKKKIQEIEIDNIPDSSYIAAFLSPRKNSVFRTLGTTEKPDVFCAKVVEGRVGILVDGSPIALTAPYILTEDIQSSEDYFVSPFVATVFRFMRFISLFAAILLPAFYISAQLFKMQLLPLGLMLTIASSVRELPLSPAMEMFVVLLLLEILKEASIRMPKYVGMSLSVVGALVLGETAVSAGRVFIHARHHHRRVFGYLSVYRTRFRRNGRDPALAVPARRGRYRTVRHRAFGGVRALLPRHRRRLRHAPARALLAAYQGRPARLRREIRSARPDQTPEDLPLAE